jgi:hypothetical protein
VPAEPVDLNCRERSPPLQLSVASNLSLNRWRPALTIVRSFSPPVLLCRARCGPVLSLPSFSTKPDGVLFFSSFNGSPPYCISSSVLKALG